MKIRPVRAEFFHADGQTDMTKLTVAFRNFAEAPGSCRYAAVIINGNDWGNHVAGPTQFFAKHFPVYPSLPGEVRTPRATSSYLLPQNPFGSLCSVTDYKANNPVR